MVGVVAVQRRLPLEQRKQRGSDESARHIIHRIDLPTERQKIIAKMMLDPTRCTECGTQDPTKADKCPNCEEVRS